MLLKLTVFFIEILNKNKAAYDSNSIIYFVKITDLSRELLQKHNKNIQNVDFYHEILQHLCFILSIRTLYFTECTNVLNNTRKWQCPVQNCRAGQIQ